MSGENHGARRLPLEYRKRPIEPGLRRRVFREQSIDFLQKRVESFEPLAIDRCRLPSRSSAPPVEGCIIGIQRLGQLVVSEAELVVQAFDRRKALSGGRHRCLP